GLVDDDPNRQNVPPPVQIQPAPPVKIQPAPPVKPVKPAQQPPAKEDKKEEKSPNAASDAEKPAQAQPAQAQPARAADTPLKAPQGGGQGGGQGGFAPANPGGGPAIAPAPVAWVPVEQGQIFLVPGKAKKADGKTSIRVRPTDNPAFVTVDKDHLLLTLELTVEPRLRWHSVGAVKVTKALDNNDQKLENVKFEPVRPNVRPLPVNPGFGGGPGGGGGGVAMPAIAIGWGGNANGLSRNAPLQFKKDKKETKSFK